MANDNGELDNGQIEIKEDAFDRAAKNHRRVGPPAELLDRCLGTISDSRSLPITAPADGPGLSQLKPVRLPSRWRFSALAVAAGIMLAVGLASWKFSRHAAWTSRDANDAESRRVASADSSFAAKKHQSEGRYLSDDSTRDAARYLYSESMPSDHIVGTDDLADTATPAERANPFAYQNKLTQPNSKIDAVRDGDVLSIKMSEVAGDKKSTSPDRSVEFDGQAGKELTAKTETAKRSFGKLTVPATTSPISPAESRPGQRGEQLDGYRAATRESAPKAEQEMKLNRALGRSALVSGQGLPRNLEEMEQLNKAKVVEESLAKRVDDGRKDVLGLTFNDHDDDFALRSRGVNAEAYSRVADNPFLAVSKSPLSTFSTDVDTASYSNVRRFLNHGTLPPKDAVRIEEMLNYFSYNYPQPEGPDPFSVNLEVAGCPWNGDHRLVRVGLKGREVANDARPPANLVFLIDVSGSMQPANKLPLLKTSLKMLMQRLGENERVAIVTYSHEIKLVLPSTTCDSRETIGAAIDSLQAAGSTNGAGGLQLAYSCAVENFIPGGINRVILATDGDFNVGITDPAELQRFIEQKATSRVFLSVLGFGYGNLKDATLERLADKGNGHFAYIDNVDESKKVLVDQLSGTLMTIAKDVKLQIEFNPATVAAYRLIGYENRIMAAQDFNDDRKDAGDIGAGHTVTALYEVVPVGKPITPPGQPGVDPLKYQSPPRDELPALEKLQDNEPPHAKPASRELLTVKLRYKQPDADQSKLLEVAVTDSGRRFGEATADTKFAAAVAAFGMILRDSPHRGTATLDAVLELADDGRGADREGYRAEFIKLVRAAKSIAGR